MVIKKVMALFRGDAKPQDDVDDVEGVCDAIDEVGHAPDRAGHCYSHRL
jgi:hypothetical protein